MLTTALVFLVILTILVLIHELGHFTVAKLVGVEVEEFGLGLPPRAWGKKFGKTIYSLNWLPIGGFVRLAGEDKDPEQMKHKNKGASVKHMFWARSKKERAAILVAGVVMNFALAVAITAGLLVHGVNEPSGRVHVDRVVENSPAEQVGLLAGDVILGLSADKNMAEKVPVVPQELISFVNAHKGQEIAIRVSREGVEYTFTAVPRVDPPKGQGALGIAITDLELHSYPLSQAPGKAVTININRAKDMLVSLGSVAWRLITLRPPQAEVAGPIGIAQVTGQAVKFGWLAVLEFASILSLNLAVLNILPIPALDGGRLMFVFVEKIMGRKVRPAFERSAHQIGMIILLGLVFLVSINDILRLVRGG